MHEPFLVYRFQGYEFRFVEDYLIVNDEVNHIKYKVIFLRGQPIPFMIEILERD